MMTEIVFEMGAIWSKGLESLYVKWFKLYPQATFGGRLHNGFICALKELNSSC